VDKPFSKLLLGVVLAGVCVVVVASCTKNDRTGPAAQARKPATIRETFDQLRQWHEAGAYSAMRPYIDAAGCEGTIDLLVAVDQLVAANAGFLAAVQRACPNMDVRPYDLAFTQDNLDLFSRRVDWVSIKEDGERAVVTAEVSGRLPLREIRFEWQADRWVYVPGPEDKTVIAAIRQMTRSLNQIELVASTRKPTDRQIHEEYRVRVLSKISKLKFSEVASSGY
jgi:hypothetical protein